MKVDSISDLFHHIIDRMVWDNEEDQNKAHSYIEGHFASPKSETAPDVQAASGTTGAETPEPVVSYTDGIRYADGVPYSNDVPDAGGFTYSSGVILLNGAPFHSETEDANGFTYLNGVRYSAGVVYSTPKPSVIPTA